ncbi:hypothetical protein CVM73_02340 [Bradyrhizobium forestalis]|uniref:Uncharacterized protein n=1 Tax=Bradyrhizobium forestalis TaxID=1419263 RepID=A0A2M8RF31_9BRAD|nr:hypothetical protein CVM73_02340 [Bradyrhizobium forestalis]
MPCVIDDRSSRPLRLALREAFEDLDAELFCGRTLELPELVPQPDHFALLFDGHEHLPMVQPRRLTLEQRENKSPAPSGAIFALNLFGAANTHGSWGFQRPVTRQRRLTNILRHRGAVAFWKFNFKLRAC